LVIRLRLNSDRYLELASLTEMNLPRTLVTISFNWGVGYSTMKHWKHSKRMALAPFFKFADTREQTVSWQITKV
jgi:hypothetical protein